MGRQWLGPPTTDSPWCPPGGHHGECGARAYNGGMGAKPLAGPGAEPLVRGSGGRSPPEAESILVIGCLTEPANLAPLVKLAAPPLDSRPCISRRPQPGPVGRLAPALALRPQAAPGPCQAVACGHARLALRARPWPAATPRLISSSYVDALHLGRYR